MNQPCGSWSGFVLQPNTTLTNPWYSLAVLVHVYNVLFTILYAVLGKPLQVSIGTTFCSTVSLRASTEFISIIN